MELTPEQIIQQAEQLFKEKKYQEIIALLSDTLLTHYNNAALYFWRAITHRENGDTELFFIYAQKSIEIDPLLANGYWTRGSALANKKEHDKAISDFTEAIRLDPSQAVYYSSRGNAWSEKKEYDKAITDYSNAIQLDQSDKIGYFYYNRGNAWFNKKEYSKAISDYKRLVELTNDPNDYYRQIASAKIEELKKKIENDWYDEIDSIIDNIKQILLFDNPCLTHYTSLSGAREMILNNINSPFRLSEGSFLNDTSEGRELFNYLSFETTKRTADETLAELFVEKPFIGSFVADNKHNDLTLWRM